jgi:hypothetical protein
MGALVEVVGTEEADAFLAKHFHQVIDILLNQQ